MKPTIRDVAKAAGVSAMAVSYVLHGTGRNVRVSEETSEKIRKAASDLRYAPNSMARTFRSGKTHMVGVVFQHLDRLSDDNPYLPLLLNGIMAALFPAGYTLALCPRLVQHGDMVAMLDGRFDGVLWARPDFTEANVESLRDARVPLVMLHAPEGSADGISTFCADNDSALRLVVDHLYQLGHRNCTFVIDEVNDHTAEGRARGLAFLEAIQSYGMSGEVWTWDERSQSLSEYHQANRGRTAMVCFSDTLAGRILTTLHSFGMSVPREISVVGFDSSTFCDRTTPKLTSVYQPVEKIAFEATSHLLSLIAADERGEPSTQHSSTLYACGLDVRESTCPPSLRK
ncbi:MAG TPA: LacI family DNA-binding transcriptional regulator [Fimbriimonadaceae bacterium]|jgi:LacI family transcriptional regulator